MELRKSLKVLIIFIASLKHSQYSSLQSGGVTPWKTWISCEETSNGQCHEVDPDPKSKNHDKPMQTLLGGSNGGQFEAVAVDDRAAEPEIFVTEDKWK